jgi:hypothetical protein
MHTVQHPPLTCRCGCAGEVERLRGLLEVLVNAVHKEETAGNPGASYADPAVARVQARKRRIAASGLRLVRSQSQVV